MTITLGQLGFRYGRVQVLEGISVEAVAGRVTAVVGPNASGKTTLLRCAAGLLRPSAGEALVDGRSAAGLRPRQLAQRVAYVAQRPVVSAAFTVREVVALGRYALPSEPGRVVAALHRTELEELADRPYPALSIGQQQRVAVARAVAQMSRDGNLILDEPTSAMDLRYARRCYGFLGELAAEGATVVAALHDLAAAAEVADDVWVLDGGRLTAAGSAREVMDPAGLERVFGVGFEWWDRGGGRRVLLAGSGSAGNVR